MERALEQGFAIVADIGKTLSKLSLWSRDGRLLDRQVRANEVSTQGALRRLDVHGIGDWLITAIGTYRDEPIEAIVPVGHGAAVVALVDDALAFAPLDYEQPIPSDVTGAYLSGRDPFGMTGSPSLPDGLNLGSQLFWLERIHPDAMRRATLVPWPQYWAWFLGGRAASEVTSLGCHSDLWLPAVGDFSPMARRLGWADRFAPLTHAGEVVGTLRPDLAAMTGLPEMVKILAGLHDSNAAFLGSRGFAEIAGEDATLLSTGTWFVAMRTPASPQRPLPEDRDCLINVDVSGQPVSSARFMGGREIELIVAAEDSRLESPEDQPALLAALPEILAEEAMLLPTLVPGCGPFPSSPARWIKRPEDCNGLRVAACLYAALMADASLELIGASGTLLIEGRFAGAEVFARAIATLRPGMRVFVGGAESDVSLGALRLLDPTLRPAGPLERLAPLDLDVDAYRWRWRGEIAQGGALGGRET